MSHVLVSSLSPGLGDADEAAHCGSYCSERTVFKDVSQRGFRRIGGQSRRRQMWWKRQRGTDGDRRGLLAAVDCRTGF